MNNNNIVAAAEIEAARNLKIYNKLADIAREVFTHINAETGKIYTPADIARAIVGGPVVTCVNGLNYRCDRVEKYEIGNGLQFADDYSPETVYNVEIDGFSCRVNGWKIFNVLDRAARAWDIASAARVTFEKPYETAARVVSFTLSAAAARELAACCANDVLRPVMNGVHLDTRRRCLVASNGHVLRVLQMGAALTVDETAAASSYIIPADVLKSGRVVTIDANGIVSTDKKSAPAIAGRYPNYLSVIPGASGRIDITADQWKQIKKAVADVAKVHDKKDSYRRVTIAHETASDKLIIHAFNYDFNRERETAVNIDTAAPAFSLSFNADYFAKIAGTPTALYIKDNSRALVAVDGSGLSLIMPLLQPSDDKYYIYFNFAESYGDYLHGLNITAAAAEIKEENEAAAAAEIVAKVREECKGKNTKSMLKYINDNFGWSSALQRARDILTAEIEREKNTAAPAADIETPAAVLVPDVANDDTAAPAADIETSETPAAVLVPVAFVDVCETPANGHRNRHGARRWFQVAAAIVAAFLLSLFSDIERETPATAAPVEIQTPANDDTANDGTPATATETATDSAATAAPTMTPPTMEKPATAKKRQPRARRHRAALSADIERETPAATSADVANDDTAAPVPVVELATPTNDDTANDGTPAAPLSADIETSETDTAAPVEIQTPANDDTANDGTPAAPLSADIETSETDTAAPVEVQTPANDDTANDGTPAPSSETPATGGTPSPSTPATGGTPATVPVSPAVLSWVLML